MTRSSREVVTVDFETLPIVDDYARPAYPPEPVGVAIKRGNRPSRYHAWGHPSGNTATREGARRELADLWRDPRVELCFFNAKFDLAVAWERMDLPIPPRDRIHDPLVMLFLDDPRAPSLHLKDAVARLLRWPPEERDAVADWLIEHPPDLRRWGIKKITRARAGAGIAFAPPGLVAPYARGDVDRTKALFDLLAPRTPREPYDRERRLLPALLASERAGMRVHADALGAEIAAQERALERLDGWLRRRLGAPGLDVDSGAQLGEALVASGAATEEGLGRTRKSGRIATNREALTDGVDDPVVLAALVHRARLRTYLSTFMRPWLATASGTGGLVYTSWSSTRSSDGGGRGARTGRLSSSPNFQNLPKRADPVWRDADHRDLPRCPLRGLPPLPNVRSFVAPSEKGHVLIDRDYNQQELRILAYYGGSDVKAAYDADPWMDFHENARAMLSRMLGRELERRPVKNTGFGLLYGMGVGKLARKNRVPIEEARALKRAYLARFAEIADLYAEMRGRAADGKPITTLGGRTYYCEEPRVVDGELRVFDYKMVNLLIQGGAADVTKEAIARWEEDGHEAQLVLTAHDEVLASSPRKAAPREMERLRAAMEAVPLSVPLLTDGKWSARSWGDLEPYDVRGEVIAGRLS